MSQLRSRRKPPNGLRQFLRKPAWRRRSRARVPCKWWLGRLWPLPWIWWYLQNERLHDSSHDTRMCGPACRPHFPRSALIYFCDRSSDAGRWHYEQYLFSPLQTIWRMACLNHLGLCPISGTIRAHWLHLPRSLADPYWLSQPVHPNPWGVPVPRPLPRDKRHRLPFPFVL